MASTRLRKTIRAPRSRVYEALLSADAVEQWMVPEGMTSEIHEFDPREGGSFRISLTYDNSSETGKTAGQTDTFHGTFVKLVRDAEVAQTIEFETDDSDLQGEMTVRYVLAGNDNATELTATHEHLPPGLSAEQNRLGWTMSIDKLARLVEG